MKSKETKPKLRARQSELRKEKHLRRLNDRDPRCSDCGEKEPAALTGTAPDILCYEDRIRVDGKSAIEDHHFAGRNNDELTVSIPGNEHRILSDMQKDWPEKTLRNPNSSPLRKAAATIRGWLDILLLLIKRILGWIPPFLEALDDKLTDRIGEQWWVELSLQDEM